MNYQGWQFETTVLIRSNDDCVRDGWLIDVDLTLPTAHATDPSREVRAVLKHGWNTWVRELPVQVYDVRRAGDTTHLRVAFLVDLPARDTVRVGLLYHNPQASVPDAPTHLHVQSGPGRQQRIENTHYVIETDEHAGQIRRFDRKRFRSGFTTVFPVTDPDHAQPAAGLTLAVAQEDGLARGIDTSAAQWRDPEPTVTEQGPLFAAFGHRAPLPLPDTAPDSQAPELEVIHRFVGNQPMLITETRLRFVQDTPVFRIQTGCLATAAGAYSHYLFRPVSPGLPDTDIEEMGQILIDPAHLDGIPDGPMFSGFLPYALPWHAVINRYKEQRHALAAIALTSTFLTPGGAPAPTYRDATYLDKHPATLTLSRCPVYAKRQDRMANAVTIPAGTVLHERHALVLGAWDEHGWGGRVDALGKALNSPLEISLHPQTTPPTEAATMNNPVPPMAGNRSDAYTRAGVR